MYYIALRPDDRAHAHLERIARLLAVYAQADLGPVDASLGLLDPMVLPFERVASFSLAFALQLAHSDEERRVIRHLAAAGYHLRFYAARLEQHRTGGHELRVTVGYSAFQHSLPLTQTHHEAFVDPTGLVLPSVTELALQASLVA